MNPGKEIIYQIIPGVKGATGLFLKVGFLNVKKQTKFMSAKFWYEESKPNRTFAAKFAEASKAETLYEATVVYHSEDGVLLGLPELQLKNFTGVEEAANWALNNGYFITCNKLFQ